MDGCWTSCVNNKYNVNANLPLNEKKTKKTWLSHQKNSLLMTDISHAAPMTLVCLAAINNYGKANWALSIVFTVYLLTTESFILYLKLRAPWPHIMTLMGNFRHMTGNHNVFRATPSNNAAHFTTQGQRLCVQLWDTVVPVSHLYVRSVLILTKYQPLLYFSLALLPVSLWINTKMNSRDMEL